MNRDIQRASEMAPASHIFMPKLATALRQGYDAKTLRADAFAGLTVSVVALPLSLALAVASGVAPVRGLFTAAVAGAVVSLLGGSRYQIAGPTGAFVVVVASVVRQFGYQGLVAATAMAGILLILTGTLRLGSYIKYIPFPVVTGFTAGIAVVIFSSQLGDILGLTIENAPAGAVGRLAADAAALGTFHPAACAVAIGTLGIILFLQRFAPRAPAFLIAIVVAGLCVHTLPLSIATIGTRFGELPSTLPAPRLPLASFSAFGALLPAAFTIYALGGIESLLSAVVADGMTGRRHRANCELVAQGFANIASAIMGGIPATGAIARTATNIRAGAQTPISGIIHSGAILAMMALFAPLASYIPMSALGAVLAVVCWNMAELHAFDLILRGRVGDRLVLIVTFLLTVFVDLSTAIAGGIILSSLIFARDMAGIGRLASPLPRDEDRRTTHAAGTIARQMLPVGVEAFELSGPFFFAVAAEFEDLLSRSGGMPQVLILRMDGVPLIDTTGAAALKRFIKSAAGKGTGVILSELRPAPASVLLAMDVVAPSAPTFADSIILARAMVGRPSASAV
jgi:sulfate permease, SulP family